MIKKHSNLVRQIVYAAFMVLFILMVERLRRNSANVEDASSATEEVDHQTRRPNTGELDFER